MSNFAVEATQLGKRYGQITALAGVSIHVERGQIFGLLGRNGAGKTTFVKILLGITKLTAGSARLLGEPAGAVAVRKRVGYLPEDHRFPDYHSGWSLLDFYGALLGVPRIERRRQIPQMLELVGIAHRMKSKIRTYSKGMKQRLGIAQVLLHNPDVLFLDEPTDGVDPVGRREIREILLRLKSEGKTIFLNSHLLGEVEMVTDHVAILELGKLIREGSIEELTREKGRFVIGLAKGQALPREDLLKKGYAVRAAGDTLWEVSLQESQTVDPIVDHLRGKGLSIRHLVEKRQTLEDIFIAAVEGEPVVV